MHENGDCYTYTVGDNTVKSMNYACFSSLNSAMRHESLKSATIILKKNYLDFFTEEDRNLYLEEIQKIGVLPFSKVVVGDELHLCFDVERIIKRHSYCCFSGMLIRCLYDNTNDKFSDIAKHFISMCKFFKNTDRGVLFTVACNVYLKNNTRANYSNSNHMLMTRPGCKILTTKKILGILNASTNINGSFTDNTPNFDINLFALKNESKTSYKKILTDSGIKPT